VKTPSYGVGIGRAWCSQKACEICSSLVQKKKLKKNIFLHTSCPNSNRPVFGLKEFKGLSDLDDCASLNPLNTQPSSSVGLGR
jgi:hypothetical protein